jgi:hypothetical protein
MTRKSYAAALDEVLRPMGFTRDGKQWSRKVGTIVEKVGLQWSQFAGTTVNLWSRDSATDELLRKAVPDTDGIAFGTTRLGQLIDGNDRWWKNDPSGPAEVAELIKLHAERFFEGHRCLEDQARLFGRANPRWTRSNTPNRIYLALTLYRMGEVEEACRALTNPPRTAPASALAMAERVRQWLEAATASR